MLGRRGIGIQTGYLQGARCAQHIGQARTPGRQVAGIETGQGVGQAGGFHARSHGGHGARAGPIQFEALAQGLVHAQHQVGHLGVQGGRGHQFSGAQGLGVEVPIQGGAAQIQGLPRGRA